MWTVLVFTTLTLVVTLVHLDKFHLGADQPASARLVTWGWLAIYAGVPVAMVVGLVLQSRVTRRATHGVDAVRLPAGLRWLLVGLAARAARRRRGAAARARWAARRGRGR